MFKINRIGIFANTASDILSGLGFVLIVVILVGIALA